jgi:hypothetical protein
VATLPLQLLEELAAGSLEAELKSLFEIDEAVKRSKDRMTEELRDRVRVSQSSAERAVYLDLRREVERGRDLRTSKALKALVKQPMKLDDKLVSSLRELTEAQEKCSKARVRLRDRYAQARTEIRGRLRAALKDPFILETLLLSSHELSLAVERFLSNEAPAADKAQRQLERSLYQHFTRCCVKTNPRATLTAVHLGRIDRSSPAAIRYSRNSGGERIIRRSSSLSRPIVDLIAARLSALEGSWLHVRPSCNPTYRALENGTIEFWVERDGECLPCLLPETELLTTWVSLVRERKWTAGQIIDQIAARMKNLQRDQIENFYLKLGQVGLLETTIRVPNSSRNGLDFLIGWCEGLPSGVPARDLSRALRDVDERLRALDQRNGARDQDARALYGELSATLARVLPRAASRIDRMTIVDSVAPWTDLVLGAPLVSELEGLIRAVDVLSRDLDIFADWAQELKKWLSEQLETRPEVSVLDLYSAIASGQVAVPISKPPANEALLAKAARLAAWVRSKTSSGHCHELELQDADLEAISGPPTRVLSPKKTEQSFIFHLQRGPTADAPPFLVLHEINMQASAGFSRWAYLFGHEGNPIETSFGKHYSELKKTYPDLWAEILPSAHGPMATANWAPSYHDGEIELPGSLSGASPSHVLRLDELFFARARGDEIGLFRGQGASRERVLAIFEGLAGRMSGLAPFLISGQTHTRPLTFAPSQAPLDHLPRLRRGRVIVARETWMVPVSDLKTLLGQNDEESFVALNRWRLSRSIPRYFFCHPPAAVGSGPPIFVDSLSPLAVDCLASELCRWPETELFRVREMLPDPAGAWMKDSRGSYAQELVVGFRCER